MSSPAESVVKLQPHEGYLAYLLFQLVSTTLIDPASLWQFKTSAIKESD